MRIKTKLFFLLSLIFMIFICMGLASCESNNKNDKDYDFTVSVNGGTILNSKGENSVSFGGFNKEAVVTVKATVPEGKQFVYWLKDDVNNDCRLSNQETFTFIIKSNIVLTAHYEDNPYDTDKSIYQVSGEGILGIGSYLEGTSVTIYPDLSMGKVFDHYEIGDQIIDSKNLKDNNGYTFTIKNNTEIKAVTKDLIINSPYIFEAEYADISEVNNKWDENLLVKNYKSENMTSPYTSLGSAQVVKDVENANNMMSGNYCVGMFNAKDDFSSKADKITWKFNSAHDGLMDLTFRFAAFNYNGSNNDTKKPVTLKQSNADFTVNGTIYNLENDFVLPGYTVAQGYKFCNLPTFKDVPVVEGENVISFELKFDGSTNNEINIDCLIINSSEELTYNEIDNFSLYHKDIQKPNLVKVVVNGEQGVGTYNYEVGDIAKVTVSNPEFFKCWTNNYGETVCAVADYSFVVTGSIILTPHYFDSINVNVEDTEYQFRLNKKGIVTADVPAGKTFVKWQQKKDDGSQEDIEGATEVSYEFMANKNMDLVPIFKDIQYVVSVEEGTHSLLEGESQDTYLYNEKVVFNPIEKENKTFSHWENVDGEIVSYSNNFITPVKGNIDLKAIYIQNDNVIKIKVEDGFVENEHEINVENGVYVTITAKIFMDKKFEKWTDEQGNDVFENATDLAKDVFNFQVEKNTIFTANYSNFKLYIFEAENADLTNVHNMYGNSIIPGAPSSSSDNSDIGSIITDLHLLNRNNITGMSGGYAVGNINFCDAVSKQKDEIVWKFNSKQSGTADITFRVGAFTLGEAPGQVLLTKVKPKSIQILVNGKKLTTVVAKCPAFNLSESVVFCDMDSVLAVPIKEGENVISLSLLEDISINVDCVKIKTECELSFDEVDNLSAITSATVEKPDKVRLTIDGINFDMNVIKNEKVLIKPVLPEDKSKITWQKLVDGRYEEIEDIDVSVYEFDVVEDTCLKVIFS